VNFYILIFKMHKKYLFVFLFSVLFLLIIQATFNFWVDPYGFHSSIKLNSFKATIINKPYAITSKKPTSIIIGNSRNLYSFELSNTKLKNSYNLSLAGIGIEPIRKLFEHSVNTSTIHRAIISLDNVCDPKTNNESVFSIDERFLINSENSKFKVFIYKILLYSSLEATNYSWSLLKNNEPKIEFSQSGRKIFFNEFDFITKGYGHALAHREEAKIIGSLKSKSYSSYKEYSRSCKTTNIDSIITIANERNIKISFFLNPINIRYWEVTHQIKPSNKSQVYQRMLIQEKILEIPIDKIGNFSGFDFLKLNSYTTENLSYIDSEVEPKYWYESSHYQLALGDLILNTMINEDFSNSGFVSNIKTKNYEKEFIFQQSIMNSWRKNNPTIVLEITDAIKKVKLKME